TQKSLGVASAPASSPRPRPANTPPPQRVPDSPPETHPSQSATVPPHPPEDSGETEDAPDDAPAPRGPGLENAYLFNETPFANAPPDVQRRIIISAQLVLMRQGYYRSGIDGVYGPEMSSALRTYQARIGLASNGRLDVETLASLNQLPEQRTRGPGFHRRMFPPRNRLGPNGEIIYIPR
ncbi:MAG TPA: peptidoglycan-binding protein, partial [Verrucomicrobiae bacterium]|nr:peptidoglycan-binding protein [Verrucomicrobiae bacterium]